MSTRHQYQQKSKWKFRKLWSTCSKFTNNVPYYKFQVAPIVVGAMGSVPKCLTNYLQMIGFSEKESKVLIPMLVIKSITGSVKICKTF